MVARFQLLAPVIFLPLLSCVKFYSLHSTAHYQLLPTFLSASDLIENNYHVYFLIMDIL